MLFKHIMTDEVEDSFQAFLVDGAEFTDIEEYPILTEDMVPSVLPEKIMHFSKAIAYQGDLSKTVIYFFSPDKSFERVRRNPQLYVDFFKRTAGIMGFDYSVHTDMPVIKQKSQMNDNLSLSFYFANKGIPLYPAPRAGSDDTVEEYLKAFPKHTFLVLGTHGFVQHRWQKREWCYWIDLLINELEPKGFIVVGHLTGEIFEQFKDKVPFYFYDSFIEERMKEVKKNGN